MENLVIEVSCQPEIKTTKAKSMEHYYSELHSFMAIPQLLKISPVMSTDSQNQFNTPYLVTHIQFKPVKFEEIIVNPPTLEDFEEELVEFVERFHYILELVGAEFYARTQENIHGYYRYTVQEDSTILVEHLIMGGEDTRFERVKVI